MYAKRFSLFRDSVKCIRNSLGQFHCSPGGRWEVISGPITPISMWRRVGHGNCSASGFVHGPGAVTVCPVPGVKHEILKTGERRLEVAWCLASPGPERAGREEFLVLLRYHCVTDDAGRCKTRLRHLPRNLSCLVNAAIARCGGRFS